MGTISAENSSKMFFGWLDFGYTIYCLDIQSTAVTSTMFYSQDPAYILPAVIVAQNSALSFNESWTFKNDPGITLAHTTISDESYITGKTIQNP